MTNSFYWHDYETWGANPSVDRPSQFAGVRTDLDLNIIGEPLVEYCQPPIDVLPHAEACLVTGITPQLARKKGLPEHEFIAKIHAELNQPGTCGAGYNSIRFDDEVTRYTLYRNYFDPYEREWRNGNSRWDIIDMVRLVYALRPDGIEWPIADGKPSFKLELLTQANGISHTSAHDAFSDVEATIALAKLVRQKKPQLFDYVLNNRGKQAVARFIDVASKKPLLHISSMFPASQGCAALVVPLAAHPSNKNAVIAYDLSADPASLESLSAEEISERLFTPSAELPEGVERIPIKLIHLNKCPVLAPTKMLDKAVADRLGIDRDKCERHWQKLLPMELEYKLRSVYKSQSFASLQDPEQKLYDGFIADSDKRTMHLLRDASEDELTSSNFVFEDERLSQMLLRYKARNFPSSLSAPEKIEWHEFIKHRLSHGDENVQSLQQFQNRVAELLNDDSLAEEKTTVLKSLQHYAAELTEQL